MALKLGTLSYDIEANTAGIKKGEQEVEKSTAKLTTGFGKLGLAISAAFLVGAVA